jgi:hypothetical protein
VSQKDITRKNLKKRIILTGEKIIPCTACEKKHAWNKRFIQCIKAEKSTCCLECVKRAFLKCNASDFAFKN